MAAAPPPAKPPAIPAPAAGKPKAPAANPTPAKAGRTTGAFILATLPRKSLWLATPMASFSILLRDLLTALYLNLLLMSSPKPKPVEASSFLVFMASMIVLVVLELSWTSFAKSCVTFFFLVLSKRVS